MKRFLSFILALMMAVTALAVPALAYDAPVTTVGADVTFASTASTEEQQVRQAIEALKSEYPEGMPWTNDNYYYFEVARIHGYGCAAFAFLCSDAAFGVDTPVTDTHTDFDRIRAGDILRINYNTHSVIVLEKKEDSVIVAEGNFNSSIHWGREISRSSLESGELRVTTRWPQNGEQLPSTSDPNASDTSKVDSSASKWARKELAEAIDAGFVPENLQSQYTTGVTRFEMAMMIVDLIETASGKNISDFTSQYLYAADPEHDRVVYNCADMPASDKYALNDIDAITHLCQLGIINGTKTINVKTYDDLERLRDKEITINFSPEKTLTRGQIAAILQRTGKVLGLTNTSPNSFKDVTAKWMQAGVDFVSANGIMKGVGGGRFSPNRDMTRQEAIITTLRFYKLMNQ